MGSEAMEGKELGSAAVAEGVGAKNEVASVGEEEGELIVKSVPNDELNSKISHDVVPGGADVGESVVAVAGSVDGSVEAPVSTGAEIDAVSGRVDPEPVASCDVVGAAEKVESWDLSEAVAKSVQDGDEKDLEPKFSEEGSAEDVDAQDAPLASVDSIEDSLEGEPVPVSSDADEKAEDSEPAGGVTEVPSKIAGIEGVSPEIPAEGSTEKVESEAVDGPVEEVHEVVEATTSYEEVASLEAVPSPSDIVEDKSIEVNAEDAGEVASILPSESADNESDSPEIPGEGPSDNAHNEILNAPVESEGPEPEAVHEVVAPTTSAEPDEESAEPESVSAPADDVEEKSVEVNSEDTSEANTVLPSESADNENVSPELPAEGAVDNVGSGTLYAPIEEVHEVVEATISAEPDGESTDPESVSALPNAVDDKSAEVNSGDVNEATTALESAGNEVDGLELPAKETADNVSSEAFEPEAVHEVEEPTTSAEPDEESAEPESVSVPPDDIEDKSADVNSEDVTEAIAQSETADNEVVSLELPTEESADNVSSEALEPEAVHEVVEPTTNEEPVEESAEPESVSAPSDNVEDRSFDVNSDDVNEVTIASDSADDEDTEPDPSAEEPPDNDGSNALYAPVEEVHEVLEAVISPEPNEESAETESTPAPADDVEEKSVAVNSRDGTEASTESGNADNEDVSPELPADESADKVSSEALEPGVVHKVVEPTTSAEPNEELAELDSPSAPDVEDKAVEVDFEDTSEAVIVLPSETADNEVVSPELSAEGSADKVDAPVEEIVEIEDAATNAKPDEESASLESVAAPSDDAQSTPEEVKPDVSVPEMEEESINATSTPLPSEEEIFDLLEEHEQSEFSHESSAKNGIASAGVDTATEIKENDAAEHILEESLRGATSGDVPENPKGPSSEEQSGLSLESHDESLSTEDRVSLVDRCIQVEELPQESTAESQRSVSIDADVNAGDEVIPEGGDIIKDESPDTQSERANGKFSVEDVSHMLQSEMTDQEAVPVANQPVEDVSYLLKTVMTDEEVKLAAVHHPENIVAPEETVEGEPPALESENVHGGPSILHAEASRASQANEVESVSREFNFNDFSEASTTSEVVRESGEESHDAVTSEKVTPYLAAALATAGGEKGNSSGAAASDTTPLEISSPPPVAETEVAPKSYNLDEVAINLLDAAEKTLEDAKSSNTEDRQASVAQSVAQIVLDESSKTGNSSEYISGVVQHVAQFAQDAGGSDPNVLPDTLARVFDGETVGSPANEDSQTKETASLGTMFSLFIVWCVSLCASRISSKDMPAPALKLAAEEVAAVLHSNAPSPPPPSQEAGSSNH